MAAAKNKTTQNNASVDAFIDGVTPDTKREDTRILTKLFTHISGYPPKMWGTGIIGFGQYHYQYDSGRRGGFMRLGFAPRKANIAIYLMGGYSNPATKAELADLRRKLGKHKIGKSCLYIGTLSDVDLDILTKMARINLDYMMKTYPE